MHHTSPAEKLRELALSITQGNLQRPWNVQTSNSLARLGQHYRKSLHLCQARGDVPTATSPSGCRLTRRSGSRRHTRRRTNKLLNELPHIEVVVEDEGTSNN
jgi:hypothetical protein